MTLQFWHMVSILWHMVSILSATQTPRKTAHNNLDHSMAHVEGSYIIKSLIGFFQYCRHVLHSLSGMKNSEGV